MKEKGGETESITKIMDGRRRPSSPIGARGEKKKRRISSSASCACSKRVSVSLIVTFGRGGRINAEHLVTFCACSVVQGEGGGRGPPQPPVVLENVSQHAKGGRSQTNGRSEGEIGQALCAPFSGGGKRKKRGARREYPGSSSEGKGQLVLCLASH